MQKGDCERAPRRDAPRRDATRAHSVPGAEGRAIIFFAPHTSKGSSVVNFDRVPPWSINLERKKHPRRILTSEILHTLRPVEVPLNTWLLGAGRLHFFKELHWQVLGQAV